MEWFVLFDGSAKHWGTQCFSLIHSCRMQIAVYCKRAERFYGAVDSAIETKFSQMFYDVM